MAEISAKDVMTLRERTNVGMMQCKKALVEADGDMEKAIVILREKGLAASVKKAGRIAAEGIVECLVEGSTAVLVEINAETDFVAKNEKFKEFAETVAKTVLKENPADVEALEACKAVDSDMTIVDLLREKILVIGENIKIRRFARVEGAIGSYVHGGGKIGVITKFTTDDATATKPEFAVMAKDVCMQVAAMNPPYICKEAVPADAIAAEKDVLLAQIKTDPKMASKPQQVIDKMIEGKLGKFYSQNCLLEQAFIKDDTTTVGAYIAGVAKSLGAEIAVESTIIFVKGEGIEKRSDDFAAEVASLTK